MSHDARAVANFMLREAYEDGKWFTPLQVLKLIYFAQGWVLARTGESLITQPIEAWKHGPVVRDVYNEVRVYGDGPILEFINSRPEEFSDDETYLMYEAYRVYGGLGGYQMSHVTHKDGSPWSDTWKSRTTDHDIIDNDLIEEFFKKKDERANREKEGSG